MAIYNQKSLVSGLKLFASPSVVVLIVLLSICHPTMAANWAKCVSQSSYISTPLIFENTKTGDIYVRACKIPTIYGESRAKGHDLPLRTLAKAFTYNSEYKQYYFDYRQSKTKHFSFSESCGKIHKVSKNELQSFMGLYSILKATSVHFVTNVNPDQLDFTQKHKKLIQKQAASKISVTTAQPVCDLDFDKLIANWRKNTNKSRAIAAKVQLGLLGG